MNSFKYSKMDTHINQIVGDGIDLIRSKPIVNLRSTCILSVFRIIQVVKMIHCKMTNYIPQRKNVKLIQHSHTHIHKITQTSTLSWERTHPYAHDEEIATGIV